MRTWILCADNLRARIFTIKTPQEEACLCRTIPCPKFPLKLHRKEAIREFARYIAEEIEIACGAGTGSKLVLCAEPEMLMTELCSV